MVPWSQIPESSRSLQWPNSSPSTWLHKIKQASSIAKLIPTGTYTKNSNLNREKVQHQESYVTVNASKCVFHNNHLGSVSQTCKQLQPTSIPSSCWTVPRCTEDSSNIDAMWTTLEASIMKMWMCPTIHLQTSLWSSELLSSHNIIVPTSEASNRTKDCQIKWHNPISKIYLMTWLIVQKTQTTEKTQKGGFWVGHFRIHIINVYYPSSIVTSSNSQF